MKKYLLTIFIIASSLVACTNDIEAGAEDASRDTTTIYRAPIHINSMAYTSPSELQGLYENDPSNVIHYSIARYLAETELIAGANFGIGSNVHPYNTWYLTSLPKVIYNYDNTPKYYEFGYVENGQIVATVTTYAKKEIAGVIAFMFNDPLDYPCPDLDYYVGNYPERFYGTEGVCYLKNCNEEIEGGVEDLGSTDEEELDWMYDNMTDEDRDGMLQDMDEEGGNLDEYITERDEYWALIDEFVESHLSNYLDGDEPIGATEGLNLQEFIQGSTDGEEGSNEDIISQLAELLDYQVGFFDIGILEDYRDHRLQFTYWSGFCGPAACAWVYRGKYDSYNGYYLPIFGDGNFGYYFLQQSNYAYYNYFNSQISNDLNDALNEYNDISASADNGLAACFYNETLPFWWAGEWQFPLYHGGLNRGFRLATNNQYHVKFTCKPYEWITLNHQPLIIAIDCSHYIVAFGYGVTRKNNGNVKDKYFLVTDNGYTMGTSHKPYMRKKNFWDLHYGLTR